MRIEKEGFVIHLEGTWCEISNKYAVLESGDVAVNEEDIPAGFAEKKLDRYIETHKIRGYGKVDGCVKRVACLSPDGICIQCERRMSKTSSTASRPPSKG